MNKKIASSIIAALMIAGSTSFTAFAAMGDGSVVIGSKAFSLEYANDPINAKEISAQIVEGGTIYVKDFDGKWINNLTGLIIDASIIPAVTYKNDSGTKYFNAEDKDVVVDGNSKVTSVSLNKTTDTLTIGSTDTLTSTVAPVNASNMAVIWTSLNSDVATVTKGVVTAVSSGTTIITATTVEGSKIANCSVTVTNIKGYVHNPELIYDLKVRSAPNPNADRKSVV